MTITLKQLEAFVAVAQTGSFSAAAQIVHVSQPALTSMIQKLERQLGLTLFDRDSRGSTVTTAGRELFPAIQRILVELNETVASVINSTTPRGGTVSIACIPSIAASFMPPLIASFERVHPQIRIVMKDAMTENRGIIDMLRSGQIDYGIASPSQESSDLQFRLLFEDELVALVAHAAAASKDHSITWSQLAAHPLIGMSYESYVRQMVDKAFAQIGVSKRPYTQVSLITTAVGMVKAGLGVTVLPSTAARVCNLEGIHLLSLTEPAMRRRMGFIYRSMTSLSPAAKHFMNFVEAAQRLA
ncbi:LysR family transcriptional regulator [Pollutimonas bauzanensis]|uniref:Transcriptional regulator, LysR family n=1 Tax=Pollutimonas bauzanensis TaxID=658167 RepID=A0A1M5ZAJ8_9BURK|nr:LysR family transcriptional regulator [Pollutimonas bauzanensis]SHI20923.1 transcriptional regulator, LysR family [Pollutimonas bauzanensis]